jgi:hypothetical protein
MGNARLRKPRNAPAPTRAVLTGLLSSLPDLVSKKETRVYVSTAT